MRPIPFSTNRGLTSRVSTHWVPSRCLIHAQLCLQPSMTLNSIPRTTIIGFAEQHASSSQNGHVNENVNENDNKATTIYTSDDGLTIEELQSAEDIRAVAKLRSDAYYEDQPTRFLETFKRQFVEAEVRSLLQRTGLDGRSPEACVCLIARREGQVIGTLDVYLPLPGPPVKPPAEVPQDDPKGSYVNNVCVAELCRRQGVAKQLMAAAGKLCKARGLERMYVHVDADNEAALRLYRGLGFEESGLTSPGIQGSIIGRRYILRWSL